MQTNWIGRSEGAEVVFKSEDGDDIVVFTTRPDTLWGATFMVLAPEHPLVDKLTPASHRAGVEAYQYEASRQSEIERTSTSKEKTGVFIGAYAINPVNGERIPIWIADYVLMTYGTGAIMAVPAHDERDFAFALKFGLPIIPVIARPDDVAKSYLMAGSYSADLPDLLRDAQIPFEARDGTLYVTMSGEQADRYIALVTGRIKAGYWNEVAGARWVFIFADGVEWFDSVAADRRILARCQELEPSVRDRRSVMEMLRAQPFYSDVLYHSEYGTMINSGEFSGTPGDVAKKNVIAWLAESGKGKAAVNYRLRDWLISRQRYWGAPIPIIYCPSCGTVPVPYEDLPVRLPETLEIPLYRRKRAEVCGGVPARQVSAVRRRCQARDRYHGYFYVFFVVSVCLCHPLLEGRRALEPRRHAVGAAGGQYWLPVDQYTGGPEHATMHLLYTRFFTKAMHDMGLVPFDEPMTRLFNQGIILGPDGNRMSKSRGNVVAPDEWVSRYGADAVRAYLMFIGPWDMGGPWNFQGIEGVSRFLDRVWNLVVEAEEPASTPGTEQQAADGDAAVRELRHMTHRTVQKVTEDIEAFKFNTMLAALMEFNNYLYKVRDTAVAGTVAWNEALDSLLLMMAPSMPHITEELWQRRHAVLPNTRPRIAYTCNPGRPGIPSWRAPRSSPWWCR